MEQIRLFIGHDSRESVGAHVFIESLNKTTDCPVNLTIITEAIANKLAPTDGTNAFSKARFLVPYLCGFRGFAIWMDGADMLLRANLSELWDLRDSISGVKVVKHNYKTKSARKYIATLMEADNQDYPRKNWSSVILWNCGYYPHRLLTPEYVTEQLGNTIHRFGWLGDDEIGELPKEWNHLVGESKYNPNARLAHFTLGIPGFEHYRRSDYATEWTEHLKAAAKGLQYLGK